MFTHKDIINLKYPLFPVTEEEKEVLRLAELEYASLDPTKDYWMALCTMLWDVCKDREVMDSLHEKIRGSLEEYAYLHRMAFVEELWQYYVDEADNDTYYHFLNMLRRVWITKLLNQDLL